MGRLQGPCPCCIEGGGVRPCDQCKRAKGGPKWPLHNPACLHCGARLILNLGELPISAAALASRRKAVLDDWEAHGHNRDQLRELAKQHQANGTVPIGRVKPTESDPPNPKKRP